MGSYTL